MNRIIATVAAAFALSFAAIAPASASDTNTVTVTVIERVSYADLNLDQRNDARTMLRRINRTARSICGESMGNQSFSERYAVRACARETTMRAVGALDHPMLTAVFEGRPALTQMMLAQR